MSSLTFHKIETITEFIGLWTTLCIQIHEWSNWYYKFEPADRLNFSNNVQFILHKQIKALWPNPIKLCNSLIHFLVVLCFF